MFNWRGFPWTNFEELNLDWVLRHIKSIEVDSIPALEKKVDDTYQYITDNLGEIVSQLATVIYNVKWSGAAGDGVTDDSAAIADALTKSNILYFPEGRYLFKNITVEEPVILFGDGSTSVLTPIRKHATTNQWFPMFTFKDSAALSNLQFKPLDPLPSESGTVYYNEAILIADRVEHFHLDRCIFDNIFEATHTSWADPVFVDFEDRHGMALYVHNCNDVCLTDCAFHEYGGDELVWISQDRDKFADGNVAILNCKFTEHFSPLGGSAINTLGGNVVFSGNVVDQFNNLYTGQTSGGSLFNLMGCNTVCNGNSFTNCKAGNYIDFTEGWFTKSESVIVTGNQFNGQTVSPCHIMARSAKISGNVFTSSMGVRVSGTDGPWDYNTAGGQTLQIVPYCADINTCYSAWDSVEIDNNLFNLIAPIYSFTALQINTAINLHFPASAGYVKYNYLGIKDNVFLRDPTLGSLGTVYLNMPVGSLEVSGNYVRGAGKNFPAYPADPDSPIDGVTAYRSFISGAYGIDELIVVGNILDMTEYASDTADGCCVVGGAAGLATNSNYHMAFNTGLGKVRDHAYAVSALASFHGAYNDVSIIAT